MRFVLFVSLCLITTIRMTDNFSSCCAFSIYLHVCIVRAKRLSCCRETTRLSVLTVLSRAVLIIKVDLKIGYSHCLCTLRVKVLFVCFFISTFNDLERRSRSYTRTHRLNGRFPGKPGSCPFILLLVCGSVISR